MLEISVNLFGSQDTVRVRYISPTRLSPFEALKGMESDIIEGSARGFIDYDADGIERANISGYGWNYWKLFCAE